jgi:hypothetical protein
VHHFVQFFEWHVFESIRNNFKAAGSHILSNCFVKDLIFLVLAEVSLLEMIIECFSGKLENIFWGTFNINSNVFWISWNLSNNRFSLQVLIKW